MQGTTQIDVHRHSLAGNNEQLNAVLCAIETDTIRQAQTIRPGERVLQVLSLEAGRHGRVNHSNTPEGTP
jgi:hypothetical protein